MKKKKKIQKKYDTRANLFSSPQKNKTLQREPKKKNYFFVQSNPNYHQSSLTTLDSTISYEHVKSSYIYK